MFISLFFLNNRGKSINKTKNIKKTHKFNYLPIVKNFVLQSKLGSLRQFGRMKKSAKFSQFSHPKLIPNAFSFFRQVIDVKHKFLKGLFFIKSW
jgi:hypothetical protein